MSARVDALMELERRGKLPPEQAAALAELRRRGAAINPPPPVNPLRRMAGNIAAMVGGALDPLPMTYNAVVDTARAGNAASKRLAAAAGKNVGVPLPSLPNPIGFLPRSATFTDIAHAIDPERSQRVGVDRFIDALYQGAGGTLSGLGLGQLLAGSANATARGVGETLKSGFQGNRALAATATGTVGGVAGSEAAKSAGLGPAGQTIAGVAGGVLGSLAPSAAMSVPRAARNVRMQAAGGTQDELAERALARIAAAMEADSGSPRQTAELMDQARQAGLPMMLADTGPNMLGLSVAAAKRPGPGRQFAASQMLERQAGQQERLERAVAKTVYPEMRAEQFIDDLESLRRFQAGPQYADAFAGTTFAPESPVIDEILKTPAGKDALKEAYRIASNERRDPAALGWDFNEAGDVVFTNGKPTLQTLDYVLSGMDRVINKMRDPLTGKLNIDRRVRAVLDLRNELHDELMGNINARVPDLAQARATYAFQSGRMDAARRGMKALTASPNQNRQYWERLRNADEREAFLTGVASALRTRIRAVKDGNSASRAVGASKLDRDRLAPVIGQEQADRLGHIASLEHAMSHTRNRVLGGSQTHELGQEAAEGVGRVARFGNAVADNRIKDAVRWFIDLATFNRMTREEAAIIARMAFEDDPDALRQAFSRISMMPKSGTTPNAGSVASVLSGQASADRPD
jgi:hypothetical protein